MGPIRKFLFLDTGGLVSPDSKKQRLAKQRIRLQKQMLKTMQQRPPVLQVASPAPAEMTLPRLDNPVVSHVHPSRKPAIANVIRNATGLSVEEATRIIETHEVIECADEDEARTLKIALQRQGRTLSCVRLCKPAKMS